MPFIVPITDTTQVISNSLLSLSDGQNKIIFDTMPKISMASAVSYQPKQFSQLPTAINYFENVAATAISISDIKFVSRTRQEATNNNQVIYYLRYLTKPNFGIGGNGMPPKILRLNGFNPIQQDATQGDGQVGGINNITVVITAFDIDWPNDCDLIPDDRLIATPIIRTGSLSLLEIHSPNQIANFDLEAFKSGQLLGW